MRILAISQNTLREALRSRVLYLCLLFAIGLIGISPLLADVSAGEEKKVLIDFGLASISFFSVLLAILIGTNLVYQEVEKKTIYTILSKPVERYEFLLGKFLGLAFTILFIQGGMFLIFLLFLYFHQVPLHLGIFQAIFLEYMAALVMTAIATFFSSFTTPILTAFFTTAMYIVGTTIYTTQLREQLAVISPKWQKFYAILNTILPNFHYWNMKVAAAHGISASLKEFGASVLYALLYITIFLLLSIFIFQRRNL